MEMGAAGGLLRVFRGCWLTQHCGNEAPSQGNGMGRQANPAEPWQADKHIKQI